MQVVSKHYTTVHADVTNCIFVKGGVTDSFSDIKVRQIRGNHLGAKGKLIVIVLLNTDINDCKHPLNQLRCWRLGNFALAPSLVL